MPKTDNYDVTKTISALKTNIWICAVNWTQNLIYNQIPNKRAPKTGPIL